ncbi:MAG: hypothetical protein K6F79_02815 [Saccharofermentans sp.]|nr:hypothetical protein [Saccharofermentans sp.]
MPSDHSDVEFYTKSTDCGTDSRLAPYVLLSDLQETADVGAADTGWGREAIGEYNCCWIVLRYRISFDRLPFWKEKFTIRTWSCGPKKLFFDREFEVFDEQGTVIGKASSVWILADKDSHRPVFPSRLDSLPQGLVQSERLVFGESAGKLPALKAESFEGEPAITKYADYSELDHNHHVNNTRYLAWVYDALFKLDTDLYKVKEININYISEVKSGQKVDIYVKKHGNSIEVAGFRDDNSGVFISEILF